MMKNYSSVQNPSVRCFTLFFTSFAAWRWNTAGLGRPFGIINQAATESEIFSKYSCDFPFHPPSVVSGIGIIRESLLASWMWF